MRLLTRAAGCLGWRVSAGMACRWCAKVSAGREVQAQLHLPASWQGFVVVIRVQGGALRLMGHGWPALGVSAAPAPWRLEPPRRSLQGRLGPPLQARFSLLPGRAVLASGWNLFTVDNSAQPKSLI